MPVLYARALLRPLAPAYAVATAVGRTALLAALPHGGQQRSRRNAWAAMATDAARARARRETASALAAAVAAAAAGAGLGAAAQR